MLTGHRSGLLANRIEDCQTVRLFLLELCFPQNKYCNTEESQLRTSKLSGFFLCANILCIKHTHLIVGTSNCHNAFSSPLPNPNPYRKPNHDPIITLSLKPHFESHICL